MITLAHILNETALQRQFSTYQEAVDHLCKVAFYTTIFPYALLQTYEALNENNVAIEDAQKLRTTSLYPAFLKQKVIPFVAQEKNYPNITAENRNIEKKGRYFVYGYDGHEDIHWQDDPRATLEKFLNVEEKGVVRGTVAYGGRAAGTVKVINDVNDLHKISEGDIMVTVQSNPSVMSAIHKAAAIIADEGGIACHAAIIARELKKPCIIGTKNATQELKDGDRVEITDNGAVIILDQ